MKSHSSEPQEGRLKRTDLLDNHSWGPASIFFSPSYVRDAGLRAVEGGEQVAWD